MNDETKSFLREKTQEYYNTISPPLPSEYENREWVIDYWDGRREKSIQFTEIERLKDFLSDKNPRRIRYSSATYSNPSENNFKEGNRTGSDIILKATAAKPDSNNTQIEQINSLQSSISLSYQKISESLGFSDIEILFDGNRSFYIIIQDENIKNIGSDARREIANYTSGRGFSIDKFPSNKNKTDLGVNLQQLSHIQGGWGADFYIHFSKCLRDLKSQNREEALQNLKQIDGIGDKKSIDIHSSVEGSSYDKAMSGNINTDKYIMKFAKIIEDEFLDNRSVQFDMAIAESENNSIPLVESINGTTGLQTTKINPDEIDTVDLYSASVPDKFKTGEVEVDIDEDKTVHLHGEKYDLFEGRISVPLFLGIYLMSIGLAEIPK